MDTPVTQLLQRARQLLERGWCRLHYAEDGVGNEVRPANPNATCFCLTGALRHAASQLWSAPGGTWNDWSVEHAEPHLDDALEHLANSIRTHRAADYCPKMRHEEANYLCVHYNDYHSSGQADLLALLDQAIADAGKGL